MTIISTNLVFLGRRETGGENYWVTRIADGVWRLGGICVDSVGEIYVTGDQYTGTANSSRTTLWKLTNNGEANTQSGVDGMTNRTWGAPAVNPAGTSSIWIPHNGYTSTEDSWKHRFNSIGSANTDFTAQYQANVTIKTGSSTEGSTNESGVMAVDSSNNIYYGGTTSFAETLWAYDSTATSLQWSLRFVKPYAGNFTSIDVDTSNVAVGSSDYKDAAPNRHGFISKITSSTGNVQWQKQLNPPSNNELYINDVALTSNGVLLVTGRGFVAGDFWRGFVASISADGSTIDWIRQYYISGRNIIGLNVKVDSSNNVYVMYKDLFDTQIYIVKYNSSGTIQWQRTLTYTSPNMDGRGLYIRGDVMYISVLHNAFTGTANANIGVIFVWKLPTNGGKANTSVTLGTSGLTMQYNTTSQTDAAYANCTIANGTATVVTGNSGSFLSNTRSTTIGSNTAFKGNL